MKNINQITTVFLLMLVRVFSQQALTQNITYDSLGCFAYMPGFKGDYFCKTPFTPGQLMSSEICAQFCAIYQFDYSSTYQGWGCCCYNEFDVIDYGDNGLIAVNTCNNTCLQNKNETCGGTDLYEINVFSSNSSSYGEPVICTIVTTGEFQSVVQHRCTPYNDTIDSCIECCNDFNASLAVLSGLNCYCSNVSANDIETFIEVTPYDLCGMTCPNNNSQNCGGSTYIGSFYNISYETRDREYYVQYQGAYKLLYNSPNYFVNIVESKLYSMVELVRICSIYGFDFGYQLSMDPIYGRLMACFSNMNETKLAKILARSNHPVDLSYINFDQNIPQIYQLFEVPKSFRMNLTKKVHIKYAGCYINTFADVIYTPVGNLTNKLCNQFCRSLNYTFSGTKQLNCFCGNQLLGGRVDDSQCSYTCENSMEICGGPSSLSVYKNNLFTNSQFYTIVPNIDVINEENNILSTSFEANRLTCGNLCNKNLQCKSFLFKTDRNCSLLAEIPDTDNYFQSSSSTLYIRDW